MSDVIIINSECLMKYVSRPWSNWWNLGLVDGVMVGCVNGNWSK